MEIVKINRHHPSATVKLCGPRLLTGRFILRMTGRSNQILCSGWGYATRGRTGSRTTAIGLRVFHLHGTPRHTNRVPAKTVVRAGYGWFYNRFSVPTSFNSFAGTPYVIQVLQDNQVNQRSYTVANPNAVLCPTRRRKLLALQRCSSHRYQGEDRSGARSAYRACSERGCPETGNSRRQ